MPCPFRLSLLHPCWPFQTESQRELGKGGPFSYWTSTCSIPLSSSRRGPAFVHLHLHLTSCIHLNQLLRSGFTSPFISIRSQTRDPKRHTTLGSYALRVIALYTRSTLNVRRPSSHSSDTLQDLSAYSAHTTSQRGSTYRLGHPGIPGR